MNHNNKAEQVKQLNGHVQLNPNQPAPVQIAELTSTFQMITTIYTLNEIKIIFQTYFGTIPFKNLNNDNFETRLIVLTELINKLCFNTELSYIEIVTILKILNSNKKEE